MVTREERKWNFSIWGFIGILVLAMAVRVAKAQTPFDVTECGGGPITIVFQSQEVTVSGLEGKGIIFSNHENKVLNNCTFQVV